MGQDAIATTLSNAIRQQRIAPAYLFTGPRGTGKTSSARILAKSLNCLSNNVPTEKPCGICEVCRAIANGSALDVIEIDAASNTGVDNIRELIERAQFAPVQCRYKVYCIDECHMLSTAAFNALLKTLEEPPDRVVFVLATTDPQRVLPTIISRCQRFDFRRIALGPMVAHLQAIAAQENIKIAEDALQLVGQLAQGGLRDAESLLDQLSLLPEITLERIWDLVGAVPEQDLMLLLEAIAAPSPEAILEQARHLMDRGREPLIVLQNLAGFYRDLLIAKTAPERNDLVGITPTIWAKLCDLALGMDVSSVLAGQQHLRACEVQLKNTTQPRLWLEVVLLGLLPSERRSADQGVQPISTPVSTQRSERQTQVSVRLAPLEGSTPSALTSNTANGTSQAERQPAPADSVIQLASDQAAPKPSIQPLPSVGESYRNDPELVAEASRELVQGRETPITPTADVQPELDQLWTRVIDHLQPLSTQALLRQLSRLIAFDGQQARVGIKSQSWFKTSQEKLPNIEAAFQTIFKREVKVRVEVAPIESRPTPRSEHPIAPTFGAATAIALRSSSASAPTSPRQPSASQLDQAWIDTPPIVSTPENTEFTAPQSTQQLAEAQSDLPATQAPIWEQDDVTRAAKSLAQFFNGEIVSQQGSEGVSTPIAQSNPSSDLAAPVDASDPDEPEVPF